MLILSAAPYEPECRKGAPTLFSLCVRDISTHPQTELAFYADDTAIRATAKNIKILQKYSDQHLLQIQEWLKLWRVKFNTLIL